MKPTSTPVFWACAVKSPHPLQCVQYQSRPQSSSVRDSVSDFQLCERLNRPSVPTSLSGIVAPRVVLPSNSHQYFASVLTYCLLSPCLDHFFRSPRRRGKPTNNFVRGCSSPCLPPLQQSPVLGNCSKVLLSVTLSESVYPVPREAGLNRPTILFILSQGL